MIFKTVANAALWHASIMAYHKNNPLTPPHPSRADPFVSGSAHILSHPALPHSPCPSDHQVLPQRVLFSSLSSVASLNVLCSIKRLRAWARPSSSCVSSGSIFLGIIFLINKTEMLIMDLPMRSLAELTRNGQQAGAKAPGTQGMSFNWEQESSSPPPQPSSFFEFTTTLGCR